MSKQSRMEFWRQMGPAATRRLALAVFFMFAIIGPIQVLMESNLRPLPWAFILLQTVLTGGLAAGIILTLRKKLLLALVFVAWAALFAMLSNGFVIEINPNSTEVHFGKAGNTGVMFSEGTVGFKSSDSAGTKRTGGSISGPVTLQPSDLNALYTQRSYVGLFAIGLLSAGYVLFIYVIRSEVRRRAKFETEVALAREIQQNLLPAPELELGWCSAAGRMIPASEVGGDYFDLLPPDPDSAIAVVADVSGHGIGAGIIAAMTKSALAMQTSIDPAPGAALNSVNRTLFSVSDEKTFVTCAYLSANRKSGTIRISTAGHLPVLERRPEASNLVPHRTPSLALGMRTGSTYEEITVNAASGSCFLLYTDGLIESANSKGEQFGMERLENAFLRGTGTPAQICDTILAAVKSYSGDAPQADDQTVVCFLFR